MTRDERVWPSLLATLPRHGRAFRPAILYDPFSELTPAFAANRPCSSRTAAVGFRRRSSRRWFPVGMGSEARKSAANAASSVERRPSDGAATPLIS